MTDEPSAMLELESTIDDCWRIKGFKKPDGTVVRCAFPPVSSWEWVPKRER